MEDKKRKSLPSARVEVFYDERENRKRMNFVLVRMLEGLSQMLRVWGELECKGGGVIDPKASLFHCHACTWNGIRNHVDQAIDYWKPEAK